MKKIISLLLVTALAFSLAIPAFAADAYVKATYFDLDFGRYGVGNTIQSDGVTVEASTNYGQYPGFSRGEARNQVTVIEDAVKGGTSMQVAAGGPTVYGISSPADYADGDRYVISFSVKGDVSLSFEGIGDISSVGMDFYYDYTQGLGVYSSKSYNPGVYKAVSDFDINEWHHIVAEIVPETSYGTLNLYFDGVLCGTSSTMFPYAGNNFSNAWSYCKASLNIGTNGGYFDDFKMYKISEAYDPAKAGDLAEITSDSLTIEDGVIEYEAETTLAEIRTKLTASAGGTIVFLNADNTPVADETVAPADTIKAAVRSSGGTEVKFYSLSVGSGGSGDSGEGNEGEEEETIEVKATYFDLDFGRYGVGNTIQSDGVTVEASTNYGQYPGFSRGEARNQVTVIEDAVKGGTSMQVAAGGPTVYGIYSPADYADGDRYVISFSVKGDVKLSFEGIGDISSAGMDFYYDYTQGLGVYGSKSYNPGVYKAVSDYDINEWHHIVAEIVPGASNGTLNLYFDSVLCGSSPNMGPYAGGNFGKAWSYCKASLNIGTNGGYFDDFKMYKITEAYNASKIGDLAEITSDSLIIEDGVIEYTTEATLEELRAKLTASASGSIVFLNADNTAVADETVAPANTIKAVARSANGVACKVYTLKEDVPPSYLTSDVYTITDGTIKGVPHFVALDAFKAAFTVDGTATPVYSTTGAYVQEGDTVTLGENVYTVKLDTYYNNNEVDKTNLTIAGIAGDKSAYGGDGNGTFEGKDAYWYNPVGAGGGIYLIYNLGDMGLKNGDVVNQEFSFFAREDSSLFVNMGNNQVIYADKSCNVFTGTESGYAGEALSEALVPDAWNKIVISAVVNDGSDENNKATKYRVFINGVQCESSNYDDGYFRKSNFDWSSSGHWSFQFYAESFDEVNTDADKVALSEFKVYKSAISDYDTSIGEAYHAEDGAIYVTAEDKVADALAAINASGKDYQVVSGTAMDTVVKITDLTGIRTETYKFRLENTIYEENGKYKAYSPEAFDLYFVTYRGNSFEDVVAVHGDGTKVLEIRNDAISAPEGGTQRVLLWSRTLKPLDAR